MKKLIAALLALPAMASAYQYDAKLASISSDVTAIGKSSVMGLEVNYMFAPVEYKDHPYAEAAFLERTGSVGISYGSGKFKPAAGGGDSDMRVNGLSAVIMGPDLPIYASIDATTTKISNTWDAYEVTFEPGVFVGDTLVYAHMSHTGEPDVTTPGSDDATTEFGFAAKYATNQFTVTGGLMQTNDTQSVPTGSAVESQNKVFNLGGDYYVSQRIGVGLEYTMNSGEDKSAEGKTIGLNGIFFATESISIEFTYNKFSADNVAGNDKKDMMIAVGGKF